MKKVIFILTAVLMLSTTDVNAQGFLKGILSAAGGFSDNDDEESEEQDSDSDEPADASNLAIAEGSDIVPKRKTSTITWDGTIIPSSASTASALMKELPQLPSAEKMARSTMEERDAYTQKIAAVTTRAEQLLEIEKGCSDAEMEALRQKW